MAIVWDIISYSTIIKWEKTQVIEFKCKYWLWITIENLSSFLDFCSVHGFLPIVDKIYIEWPDKENIIDISNIKKLYTIFSFLISEPWDQQNRNSLDNEMKKKIREIKKDVKRVRWQEKEILEHLFKCPVKEVLEYLERIVEYTTSSYQYLFWERLEKLSNILASWVCSENIFIEIAIRLENHIREKIWIGSSYLKLASYKEDMKNKTDMKLTIQRTPMQRYQKIPVQFTTGSTKVKDKEKDVEEYLLNRINEWKPEPSFIFLSVGWEFSKHITHWEKKENSLNERYNNWLNNPYERGKLVAWPKFPLFIDKIEDKILQPAEIMYIALHMLYKKYNFRYTLKETYLSPLKKCGKIDKRNHWVINWIELSEIFIRECSATEVYPWLLKHKFVISYLWIDENDIVWEIVVYESKTE